MSRNRPETCFLHKPFRLFLSNSGAVMYRTDVGGGERSTLLERASAKHTPVPETAWGRHLKRAVDIAVAFAFLAMFLWVYVVMWLAVRLTTGSPVIYRHQRVGLNGAKFYCL